jgi:hypothetical protein
VANEQLGLVKQLHSHKTVVFASCNSLAPADLTSSFLLVDLEKLVNSMLVDAMNFHPLRFDAQYP